MFSTSKWTFASAISTGLMAFVVTWHIHQDARVAATHLIESPDTYLAITGRPGDTLLCRIRLHNVSGRSLRLLGAHVSCGCLVINSELPHCLKPDEYYALLVNVHFDDTHGNVEIKRVALLLNNGGSVPPFLIGMQSISP